MSRIDPPAILVKLGEGRSVSLGGMGVVFKVSGANTGGAFAIVEHPIDAGRLVLPHVHRHEDEYSYVLEGTIGARVGDNEIVAGPGTYVIKPRGLMHTFWNAGPGPARLLEMIGGWPGHKPVGSNRVPHPRVGRVGLGFLLPFLLPFLHSGTISIPTSPGSPVT
jgi:quercetin dioxygenase-like cupin family protein